MSVTTIMRFPEIHYPCLLEIGGGCIILAYGEKKEGGETIIMGVIIEDADAGDGEGTLIECPKSDVEIFNGSIEIRNDIP